MKIFSSLIGALLLTANAEPVPYDVVVYGGTSGGVIAAVQAARSGKDVVLISPTEHLGGLTSSGLGWTDLGTSSILGGISREFYHRVYLHYQDDAAWNWQTRGSFGNAGQGGPAFNDSSEIGSVFEPKVAEKIFNDLLTEENVPVITGRLDLSNGVVMNGDEIAFLRLEGGSEYSGKVFIDASYEGDLLPGAGVSFTVGREANSLYGETVNGIQAASATKNQLRNNIDPYVVAGDAESGLLDGVEVDAGGLDGEADSKLQAYCFRMTLTDVAANRVMITQPSGYDEADYELLFRSIEAGQSDRFFKLDLMPNRKTDSNNASGISTDYIGKNYGPGWDWTTLNHDERIALALEHENWQRGLVWTLQNHPRVPASIRNSLSSWGLPADEYTDNGNWPHQIYVREARRMVSDYVMTQKHCTGAEIARDSVGLAAYSMDSHNTQRHVKNGMVKNEGDVQLTVPNPYPVSYRSIIPKEGECTNLLVPWSLSASHMAFGSIRMEPVFMILSQSAAMAADLVIDQDIDVQDLSYSLLRQSLLGAGQALGEPVIGVPTSIIDNSDSSAVTVTGDWLASSATSGFIGADYFHDNNSGKGTKEVSYEAPQEVVGTQGVFLRWTSHENRASNITVEVRHSGEVSTVTVDQRSKGGRWNLLGIYEFNGDPGEGVTIRTTGANGYVIADAVGFLEFDPEEDSDSDGMSDIREWTLGLDPFVSDASFIEAVVGNPDFFGLHSQSEIFEIQVAQPLVSFGEPGSVDFGFSLRGVGGDLQWETFEDFNLTIPKDTQQKFFRVALQTDASTLVSSLAAGLERTVVVYGTSLTANGAWVTQMNSWLSAKYPGLLTIINSGLSGKNSADGVAQLNSRVLVHSPDTVFIEFAMNDAFRYSDGTPSLSVAEARANLLSIIDGIQGQNPDVEIILQTMNTVWDSPAGSNQSASLRPDLTDFYQMYRDVAVERSLRLIDHEVNWAHLQSEEVATYQNYVPDGVHPIAVGISRITLPLLKWKLSGGNPLP